MKSHQEANSVHLRNDSDEPSSPGKDVLRVYGMKFCPFTHRLKLVLAAKGVDYEMVNINLKSKPKWYSSKNCDGKIPTLEVNGILITESDVTSEYVDAAYKGKTLTTTDPLKRAQEKMLLVQWGKSTSGYYKYAFGNDENDKIQGSMQIKEGFEKVEKYLKENGGPFICGSEPGLADYVLYPHLERIAAIIPIVISQFERLQEFYDKMQSDPAVQACRHSNELHRAFIHKASNGDVDACDVCVSD
uniref:Glutathione S-transferase omega n=1 Tax=Ciona savignyi TaxID=51511 RepID=H2ZQ37_CIOSA